MKKQGKHIRYLKILVEYIVNNISIIGVALFLFLLFLRIDQVSGFGIKLLQKINAIFFSKIDPQNYQIINNVLLKSANAVLSVVTSILINKLIPTIAKKKKYTVKLRREIYYKLRK